MPYLLYDSREDGGCGQPYSEEGVRAAGGFLAEGTDLMSLLFAR